MSESPLFIFNQTLIGLFSSGKTEALTFTFVIIFHTHCTCACINEVKTSNSTSAVYSSFLMSKTVEHM